MAQSSAPERAAAAARNESGSRLNLSERLRVGLYIVQLLCLMLIAYNPFNIHLSTLGLVLIIGAATVAQAVIDRRNRIAAATAKTASPAPVADERQHRAAPEQPTSKV